LLHFRKTLVTHMAHTARTAEEEKEYFDSPQTLDKKIDQLAQMIKECKHFTVFTGAGISTSAGIPDFRSGVNTVLETGVGAWAKAAAIQKGIDVSPKKPLKIRSTLQAIPTPTHMALVELNNRGILKYLMSQNCDGLHRRSGFDPNCISELHGNTNLEFCKKCGKQYLRDFRTRKRGNHVHDHRTDRKCTKSGCGGVLYDTIINFGENLNDYAWDPAEENADKSDCCLVLGSSLSVTPAADLPASVGKKKNGKFCIVNLQKTDMDHLCDVRIFAKCDDVMIKLVHKLGFLVPSWKLKRYIQINTDSKTNTVSVFGIDVDGTPYDILSSIKLIVKDDKVYEKRGKCLDGAVFKVSKKVDLKQTEICLQLAFMGHYNESALMVDLHKYWDGEDGEFVLNLSYCPHEGKWSVDDVDFLDDVDHDAVDEVKNDENAKTDEKAENATGDAEEIYVGNLHESIQGGDQGKNRHVWTMFVSAAKDKLVAPESVQEVKYVLHPTFTPSEVTVKEAPFYLKRVGWGTFEVGAVIKFKKSAKRKALQCAHELDFEHAVSMTPAVEDGGDAEVVYSNDIKKFSK